VSKGKGFKIGRDAKSGLFMPVTEARKRPSTTVVEVVPKRGPEKKKWAATGRGAWEGAGWVNQAVALLLRVAAYRVVLAVGLNEIQVY
jgi:hypothetical protein